MDVHHQHNISDVIVHVWGNVCGNVCGYMYRACSLRFESPGAENTLIARVDNELLPACCYVNSLVILGTIIARPLVQLPSIQKEYLELDSNNKQSHCINKLFCDKGVCLVLLFFDEAFAIAINNITVANNLTSNGFFFSIKNLLLKI